MAEPVAPSAKAPDAVARNGHGIVEEVPIPPEERRIERLLMGLRLAEGITFDPVGLDLKAVERLAAQGLLAQADGRLATTPRGMLLLDAILAEIVS